jgi:hypothetical protein
MSDGSVREEAPLRRPVAPARPAPIGAPLPAFTGEFRVPATGEFALPGARGVPSEGGPGPVERVGSPAWLAARARNAWRRPILLLGTGGLVLLAAVLVLVALPRGVERVVAARLARLPAPRDTQRLLRALEVAQGERRAADSALAAARARASRFALLPADLTGLVQVDSLDLLAPADSTVAGAAPVTAAAVDRAVQQLALRLLVERARSAPLAVSFRALAQSPELAGEAEVRALVDSLDRLETRREASARAGGADPAFVATTTELNAIGARLIALATARLAPAPGRGVGADTMPARARADSAERLAAGRGAALEAARQANAALRVEQARARATANLGAPPAAMLAAGIALALALAYALALIAEVRRPVVGDLAEVARVAGTRVIRYDGAREGARRLRTRRSADRRAPPVLDLAADSFRLLHLAVSPTADRSTRLLLTGDDPAVVAATAVNLAAIASAEARHVLLLDADPLARLVLPALGRPATGGLDLVARGVADPAEVRRAVRLGRDQLFDVIGAGESGPWRGDALATPAVAALLAQYDLTIVCAPAEDVAGAPVPPGDARDAILCCRVGATPLGRLARQLGLLRARGVRVRAVLVWATDPPPLLMVRAPAAAA